MALPDIGLRYNLADHSMTFIDIIRNVGVTYEVMCVVVSRYWEM